MATTTDTDWTPTRINNLRSERGQSQAEFGLEIYDTTPEQAQVRISEMENGRREPTQAIRRTLERMEAEEI